MKSLPLSYNRDMQEDKIHLFSGLETVNSCVSLMTLMLKKTSWKTEKMALALRGDFSNATDLADDLAGKGMSFREAHEVVGQIVQWCISQGKTLESLTLAELKGRNSLFDEKSLAKLSHGTVMKARTSEGGTAPKAVLEQIKRAKQLLKI